MFQEEKTEFCVLRQIYIDDKVDVDVDIDVDVNVHGTNKMMMLSKVKDR